MLKSPTTPRPKALEDLLEPALLARLGHLALLAFMLIGVASALGCRAPSPELAADMSKQELLAVVTRELPTGTPRPVVESRVARLGVDLPATQVVDFEADGRVFAEMPDSLVRPVLERAGWRASPPRPTPDDTLVYELQRRAPTSDGRTAWRVEPSLRGLVLTFSPDQRLRSAAVTPWIGYRPGVVRDEGFVIELRERE